MTASATTYELGHVGAEAAQLIWQFVMLDGLAQAQPAQPVSALLRAVLANGERKTVRVTFTVEDTE